jgi:hypothetical protein
LSTTALRINHKDEQFAKKALSLHEKFQILEIITFWPYMAYLENCKKQSVFALLAGQPLMLIGATGPVLVFEQSLYMVSTSIQVQSLTLNSPFILCFLQFSK